MITNFYPKLRDTLYDNGYVRLTALPTGILLFPQRFASAPHRAELSRPFRAVFQWLIVND